MLGEISQKLTRKRCPWWIVADMDSTLIKHGTDKSALGDLSISPCAAPLFEWLETGGRLLVVTSDDGYRPFTSLWEQIPAALRANGAVCLSSSDGAALYTGDAEGAPQECAAYWQATTLKSPVTKVSAGGVSDADSVDHDDHNGREAARIDAVMVVARRMLLCMLRDLLHLDSRTQTEEGMHARHQAQKLRNSLPDELFQSYSVVLHEARTAAARANVAGAGTGAGARSGCGLGGPAAAAAEQLDRILPMSRLLKPGGVRARGTMLWRNQAGPVEGWSRTPGKRFLESLAETQVGARYTNVWIMGMPRAVSERYIALFADDLANLGFVASAAPNTVCLKRSGVTKASAVEWFAASPSLDFDLRRAVAFGDQPSGNDSALTQFVQRGMPFVSVAHCEHETPEHLRPWHVGGLEHGTAAVLRRLLPMLHAAAAAEFCLAEDSEGLTKQLLPVCATVRHNDLSSAAKL
eukprot:g2050.t1